MIFLIPFIAVKKSHIVYMGGDTIRTSAPVKVIVHYPNTKENLQELERRVADIHADFVISKVKKINCQKKQKKKLLDTVIKMV